MAAEPPARLSGVVDNSVDNSVDNWLARLGPMLPSEAGFPARTRVHQAWYRSEVLGLETFGCLPGLGGQALGSVLDASSAAAGLNFLSEAASSLYSWRRTQGWGVDPARCLTVMTSSQVLTLNIFGLVRAFPAWGAEALSEALCLQIEALTSVEVEVSNRGLLGHATYVDAITGCVVSGKPITIGWEVKLCDRFSSRNLSLGDKYSRLVCDARTWRDDVLDAVTRPVNALFRCHALTLAMSRSTEVTMGPFVLLRQDMDPIAPTVVETYRGLLASDDNLIDCRLSGLIGALEATAPTSDLRAHAEKLRIRYVALGRSEAAWQSVVESSRPRAG